MRKYAKWILLVAVMTLGTGLLAQSLISGWFLGTASSASACPIVSTFGLCGVTSNPPTVDLSLNGGPYVQLYPSTSSAGVTSFNGRTGSVTGSAGDYAFSQLTGQITGAQLPATSTCTVTYSNFTSNGSGGGTFTGVTTACK